jgi:hypothetical protein
MMNTLMEFQVIEVGSAYLGRYKVSKARKLLWSQKSEMSSLWNPRN